MAAEHPAACTCDPEAYDLGPEGQKRYFPDRGCPVHGDPEWIAAQDRLPVQARADASGGGSRVTWRGLYKHDPDRATIPAIVGEAAWEGYAADGNGGQSCERLHQRGGFGLAELGYFLVRAVDEGRIKIEVVR